MQYLVVGLQHRSEKRPTVEEDCTFFRMLADNYRKRAPVPTLRGMLTDEEDPPAHTTLCTG